MTSIDPIRRAARLRRSVRPDNGSAEAETKATDAGMAIPGGQARTAPPEPETPAAAAFDAQLIGQVGERRGLRAGPAHIEGAAKSYNRAEWSGAHDRRARKGGITKTDI
jgi:hypothetical protein